MKSIEHLLNELGRRNILLRAEGTRLHVNTPKSAMTAELAGSIRERKGEILTYLRSLETSRVIIPKAPDSQEPVLSFAQQRMWFLDQLEGGEGTTSGGHYNMPFALRLRGNLDHAALERTFSAISERHEAMRSLFPSHEGEPRLLIQAPTNLTIEVLDLGDEEQPLEAARLRVFATIGTPFDLATGPLLRLELMRLDKNDHILCMVLHHIISDGWSSGVLVNELTRLYNYYHTEKPGEPFPLPELELQYSDFAHWQRGRLTGQVRENQISYWKKKLAGIPSLHGLPTDRPRPRMLSYRGTSAPVLLEADLTLELEQLARDSGVSLFMLLQAAFATLLHRYSGDTDLCIGTPIANRNHKQLEPLIGLFVNTLVMRNDLSGDPRFCDFLARVSTRALEAYGHQDIPFEQVLENLHLERTLSYSPVFQIMFAMGNTPSAELNLPELSLSPVSFGMETAKFDLNLSLNLRGDRIAGGLEYSTDLFDRTTIDRMINHLSLLLTSIVGNPQERLSRLRLLDADERDLMLHTWNDTQRPGPGRDCIHQLFELQVARTPHALAMVDETTGTSYSYRELNQWAEELAAVLRFEGVTTWTRVGLMVERSAQMIAGIYAILKAGGAYVPIDPNYPRERIAFILEDCEAPVLLSKRVWSNNLPVGMTRVLFLEETLPTVNNPATPVRVEGDHLIYIIYTSGSTGQPKGAGVTHQSFTNMVHWFISDFALGISDRVLLTSSVSFDLTQKNMYAPLLVGGTLHLAPPPPYDPTQITELVARRAITWLNCTPSAFYPLIEDSGPGWETRLSSLRWLFLGGEPISIVRLKKWLILDNTDAVVVNTYGPTECTDISNFNPMYEPLQFLDKATPIGRPVYNVGLLVLDRQLGLLPLGGQGELCIYGASVGTGYLGDTRLTAAKFLPNPYSDVAGDRLYRTGDLVRYLPDSNIVFLGRIDHQVKIRGFRIEMGEVEAALIKMDSVLEAVAMIREDGDNKLLVAYVQLQEGYEWPDFRTVLSDALPEHMIPGRFVVLDAFALTPSGKVDRKALPAVGPSVQSEDDTAPRDPNEETIAAIWAEILSVERVGIFANFFKLGGHSLLATRVVSRICESFSASIPLQAIFEEPTVAGLAQRVGAAKGARSTPIPLLARDPEGTRLPLSFAQERLWFLYRLEGPSATYNIPLALRLRGTLDVGLMAGCYSEMVRRHETLRTCFPNDSEMPLQLIAAPGEVTLPVIDLRDLAVPVREALLAEVVERDGLRRFYLEKLPLLSLTLLRLKDNEFALLMNMHHIISDGWSMSLFAQDLVTLYGALASNKPAPPELAVQYGDYAVWQRQWLEDGVMEQQLDYWRRQLGGEQAPLAMPTDRVRPAVRSFKGADLRVFLEAGPAQNLRHFSSQEEGTLFMTLLATFYLLLQRHTGQDQISVGTPIAGRTRMETEALIGFFLNTLVLRADLSGNPSFREFFQQVRAITVEAYNNQDVPFEKLLEVLRPERDPSRTPLFQVLFNMLNLPESEAELSDLKLEALKSPDIGAKFDLTFYITEAENGVVLSLHYNADLFNEQRMREFLDQYLLLLGQVGDTPDLPIGAFDLRTATSRSLLPDPTVPLDDSWQGGVPELMKRVARRQPMRVAVSGEKGILSYEELRSRSCLLANCLAANGVEKGDVVAVLGARCPSLVVAIYAILEAGAAFTILDPAYPPSRLETILEQTQPKALICLESAGVLPSELERTVATIHPCLKLPANGHWNGARPEPLAPMKIGRNDLAYISFTSGSTGKPKGIMGRHGSLTHFLPWLTDTFSYTENDRFSMLSGLSHDPLQRDIFTPLSLGAGLYIPSRDDIDPSHLPTWMCDHGISVAHLTPAMAQMLTESGQEVSCLRLAYLTGDVLTQRDVARLRSVAKQVTCVNSYGSTETQRAVGVFIVKPECESAEYKQLLPLGTGAPNVQLLILGQGDRQVGFGEIGEIHMRSPHIALGYLGEPGLTRKSFVANPFNQDPTDLLYRTGDLGYYRPDGHVIFAGRVDDQVKIRGFRIEPREIEAALAADPSVREAVVLAREQTPGQCRLIAYLLLTSRAEKAGVAPVRARLRERLPDFMVPAHFVVLEKLPLNPNGKIDRAALPVPEPSRQEGSGMALPKTEVEEILAGIWQQLLELEQIGRDDHFFDLGGHSLLAARVISRVRSAFEVELPLRCFFTMPTLAALAAEIDRIRREAHGMTRPKLTSTPRTDRLPLSFAQRRMWFIDQLQGPGAAYSMPAAARLRGKLQVTVLQTAFQALIDRHETLRTSFPAEAGQPYQLIEDQLPVPFPVLDLSSLEGVQTLVDNLARQDAQRPFNLAKGPVIRACLVRLAVDDHVFLMGLHHIVGDAWSVGLILGELGANYAAISRGRPSPFEPLPLQYADFSAWQNDWLQGEVLAQELAYWKQALAGAPTLLALPTQYPRPALQSGRGTRETFSVNKALTDRLLELGRAQNTTLFTVLMATFNVLLSRYSGQTDILVGSGNANRNQSELEEMVGLFADSWVLRTDLSGEPGFRELLAAVKTAMLSAFDHRDISFDQIVDALQIPRQLAYSPLVQVMLILNNAPSPGVQLPELTLSLVDQQRAVAKMDMVLSLSETPMGLIGSLEYNTDIFDQPTMARFLAHFVTLLSTVVDDIETPVSQLSYLTREETEDLLTLVEDFEL